MNALLKTRETLVWLALVLMLLSISIWALSSQRSALESDSGAAIFVLLTLTFFKVSLIMGYFMEVRHASNDLKIRYQIWLMTMYILVTAANVGAFN
ncbi:cytochrome C oxidase subunit IV family protein [Zhongshania sp. BJYM1]|uniref:cytochrome C oxidase subunit IV family protein n=1 Tax=Zhongshania aquatica TaxID=2965069 RepID=UPI0022B2F4B3|nr:cytochrome C oxidase subunit IV family protein [Marortus sp. BJYM1]